MTGPDRAGTAAWWFAALAVWRAGGRPVRLTPSQARRARGPLDALVIGGGADVDPNLYDASAEPERPEPRPRSLTLRTLARYGLGLLIYPLVRLLRHLLSLRRTPVPDRRRDALELALLGRARDEGLAVLGICRGGQLLNVFWGGSLHRDIRGFYVETPQVRSVLPRKRVCLTPGSRLAEVMGCAECRVNALHDQAVGEVAGPLAVAAREPNGVIQAVEHPDAPFLIGVQWHPEYLPQLPEHQALFVALVAHARRRETASAQAGNGTRSMERDQ